MLHYDIPIRIIAEIIVKKMYQRFSQNEYKSNRLKTRKPPNTFHWMANRPISGVQHVSAGLNVNIFHLLKIRSHIHSQRKTQRKGIAPSNILKKSKHGHSWSYTGTNFSFQWLVRGIPSVNIASSSRHHSIATRKGWPVYTTLKNSR